MMGYYYLLTAQAVSNSSGNSSSSDLPHRPCTFQFFDFNSIKLVRGFSAFVEPETNGFCRQQMKGVPVGSRLTRTRLHYSPLADWRWNLSNSRRTNPWPPLPSDSSIGKLTKLLYLLSRLLPVTFWLYNFWERRFFFWIRVLSKRRL